MTRVLHLCAFLGLVALALARPSIPVLPQSFSVDYKFQVLGFPTPFFSGRLITDHDVNSRTCGGAYLSINDINAPGGLPFSLKTALISAPGQGDLENFLYLSPGRCWDLGTMQKADLCFPLTLRNAIYKGETTIGRDLCSIWQFALGRMGSLNLTIRSRDTAIMRIDDDAFRFSIVMDHFTTVIDKSVFATPQGPCPMAPGTDTGNTNVLKRLIGHAIPDLKAQHNIMALMFNIFGLKMEEKIGTDESFPSSNEMDAPRSPPQLPASFTTDVRIGSGRLVAANNFAAEINYVLAHFAFDNQTGGSFIRLNDDPAGYAPFEVNTSFIGYPTSPRVLDGYTYLSYGRCWAAPYPTELDSLTFNIPDDATFDGIQVVYGKKASLWTFSNIQVAVDVATSTPLFVNVINTRYGDFYMTFENYDATRPKWSVYAKPSGPCPVIPMG